MNYFEHHIGDYDKNTAHLTACEDGIYHRLIRRYYDKEAPLPSDRDKVKRIARARDEQERQAVDAILDEFFALAEDGWHHKVCDEVIAKYKAGQPERDAKQKNEETRLARHRQERSELFSIINAAGQHLPWNTKMDDLRAAAAKLRDAKPATGTATAPETPDTATATPATQPATLSATPPATGTATPATATQTPITTPQSPDTNHQVIGNTPLPPKGGRARRTSGEMTEDMVVFETQFWPLYPNKADKKAAYKAWKKLKVTPELLVRILAGLAKWKAHSRWRDRQFIHNCSTWLNGEMWDDEEVCGALVPGQAAPGVKWWLDAGFEHPAEAANEGCHIGNYREFREGRRITSEAPA
jgi:uncharacterized protein YdaU (DUF1376 family)